MKIETILRASLMLLLGVICQLHANALVPQPMTAAPCNADFYGIELGAFPACHEYWTKQNLSLVTLSQYELDGSIYFAGSFQGGPKRRARWGLSQQTLEKVNAEYVASGEGWRLDQVNVLTTSQGQFYAAIWVPDLKIAWENHNYMLQAQFDQRFGSMDKEGWQMSDIASYRVRTILAGQPYMAVRWSGVWAGNGFGGSAVHDNMTMDDFATRDQGYQAQGMAVTRFISYRGDSRKGNQVLHAAIWRPTNKLPAATWRLMPNTTFPEFQKMYNALGPQGYRLYYINVVEDTVSAIWFKPMIVKIPGSK
ncbi:MAG: hypothetical protein QOI77_119 [Blastocatellia bacterium]|jgi:hypothetical protein|nr:hypothetical protein [Blastocatellia bacterium]